MSSSKYPPEKRTDKWKALYSSLKFLNEGKMVCTICSSQKEIIGLMPNFNSNFILGSTNIQASGLKDYDASKCHNQEVCEKEHEEAVAAGTSLTPRKVLQHPPSNLSIV